MFFPWLVRAFLKRCSSTRFKSCFCCWFHRVVDLLATEPAAKRRAVLEHMTLALQPILEKGIVDHSIIHRAIVEYLSISKKVRNVPVIFVLEVKLVILWHSKFWGLTLLHWLGMQSMIQEVVQQLSGALLVRMLHTRDGAKVGVTCVMHGSNKVSMVLL